MSSQNSIPPVVNLGGRDTKTESVNSADSSSEETQQTGIEKRSKLQLLERSNERYCIQIEVTCIEEEKAKVKCSYILTCSQTIFSAPGDPDLAAIEAIKSD